MKYAQSPPAVLQSGLNQWPQRTQCRQKALNLQYRRLRLILGDQLNREHSWFSEPDEPVLIVVAGLKQEASYVRHYMQKICAFFAAMEHFAKVLSGRATKCCIRP